MKKEKDFIRNLGREVEIHTYRAFDHCKEFCGTLESYDADSVTIQTGEEETRIFSRKDIALIREYVEW